MTARLTGMLVTMLAAASVTASADEPSRADLDEMLTRLDRSALVYRDVALRFGCRETIAWTGRGGRRSTLKTAGRERFGYVVAYDGDDGFGDYRTRIRRHEGKKPPRRVRPERYGVPRYLASPYLWIFTFRSTRQARHEYEIVGEDEVLGRAATVVSFRPVLPIEAGVNDWYGTAWVDTETALLLQVVAMTPDDHLRVEEMNRHAQGEAVAPWLYEVERITTLFETEAHGLRFPSRVEIERTNYHLEPAEDGWAIRPEPLLRVVQAYDDYEFFGVGTRTEQGRVRPPDPIDGP